MYLCTQIRCLLFRSEVTMTDMDPNWIKFCHKLAVNFVICSEGRDILTLSLGKDANLIMSKKEHVHFVEECYSLYEQKMYRVALSILRNPTAAEDAVQDAFLKLMRSKKTFEDAESDECKRYIIAVIRNSAISIYRVRQRDSRVIPLDDLTVTGEYLVNDEISDASDNISNIIENLPSKYKDVVNCLVTENLSVRETASRLHMTEAGVRKRFERAKKKIKEYAQQQDRRRS